MELYSTRKRGKRSQGGKEMVRPAYRSQRSHGLGTAADRMEAMSHNGYQPLLGIDPGTVAAEANEDRSHQRRGSNQRLMIDQTQ